jgi:hypothetical protein
VPVALVAGRDPVALADREVAELAHLDRAAVVDPDLLHLLAADHPLDPEPGAELAGARHREGARDAAIAELDLLVDPVAHDADPHPVGAGRQLAALGGAADVGLEEGQLVGADRVDPDGPEGDRRAGQRVPAEDADAPGRGLRGRRRGQAARARRHRLLDQRHPLEGEGGVLHPLLLGREPAGARVGRARRGREPGGDHRRGHPPHGEDVTLPR